MKMKFAFLIQTSLIAFLLSACGAPTPAPTPTPTAAPAVSVNYHFVTSQLLIPTTQAQADSFALNIDGDPQNKADNLFGGLLTLLNSASPGLELQATIDKTITGGQIVSLHSLQGDSQKASWSVFAGETAASAPRFDGTDTFKIDAAISTDVVLTGSVVNGRFDGGPGEVRAQFDVLGAPIDVSLLGVRLAADVSEKGCTNGRVGGGISVTDFQGKMLPALANGLNRVIAADQTLAPTLSATFDTDQNGTVTAEELQNNLLLKLATTPDLDLLDAAGKFNPRQDGVNDSMSVGLGFTCAPAIFTAPAE